jgi:ankyrin repeat protein
MTLNKSPVGAERVCCILRPCAIGSPLKRCIRNHTIAPFQQCAPFSNLHEETVKALLEGMADVNARADDGATALILAATEGSTTIVEALLNKGADMKTEFTAPGKIALALAEENGHTLVAELLETHANRVAEVGRRRESMNAKRGA